VLNAANESAGTFGASIIADTSTVELRMPAIVASLVTCQVWTTLVKPVYASSIVPMATSVA